MPDTIRSLIKAFDDDEARILDERRGKKEELSRVAAALTGRMKQLSSALDPAFKMRKRESGDVYHPDYSSSGNAKAISEFSVAIDFVESSKRIPRWVWPGKPRTIGVIVRPVLYSPRFICESRVLNFEHKGSTATEPLPLFDPSQKTKYEWAQAIVLQLREKCGQAGILKNQP